MDDSISREAALGHYRVTDPAGTFVHCSSILKFIESLPSAQPERNECQRCSWSEKKGCAIFCGAWNRYTAHKGYCHQFSER